MRLFRTTKITVARVEWGTEGTTPIVLYFKTDQDNRERALCTGGNSAVARAGTYFVTPERHLGAVRVGTHKDMPVIEPIDWALPTGLFDRYLYEEDPLGRIRPIGNQDPCGEGRDNGGDGRGHGTGRRWRQSCVQTPRPLPRARLGTGVHDDEPAFPGRVGQR